MKPSNGDIALQNYIDEQLGQRKTNNVVLHPSLQQTAFKIASAQRATPPTLLLIAFFILFTISVAYFFSLNKISDADRQPLAINASDPVLVAITSHASKPTNASVARTKETQTKYFNKLTRNPELNLGANDNASTPFVVSLSNHEWLPTNREVSNKSPQTIEESAPIAQIVRKENLTELAQHLAKRNADSVAKLDLLYQQSPHDPAVFLLWLKHYLVVDFNNSLSQAKRWLQENDGNPAVAQFTAESLLRSGRASEAIVILNEQAQRTPLSFDARLIDALAWQKIGEHDAAIQRFKSLLLQAPEHSHLHAAIAISLSAMGATRDANLHWQVALRDPNLPIALRHLATPTNAAIQ